MPLVFFILASFFKELFIVGLRIDPEVLHLDISPGRKRTSLPHNFSKKPWNLSLMSYFRLCPTPYKSLETEEKNTLIGQSESCTHHWSTLRTPACGRRAGEGRLPRGKPESSYQRKEKCFPDNQNNTCPPRKVPSNCLFIDVLIRKPRISEMMRNMMCEGQQSQEKL